MAQLANPGRIAVLLMAGGAGARLWPLSRATRPKPFLHLMQRDATMLQATRERLPAWLPPERIFVIVGAGMETLAQEQLPDVPPENIIVAPDERETLPSLGYATAWIEASVPDATLVLLASDSAIGDTDAFQDALERAVRAAQMGPHLVSVGVAPSGASTLYGYMELGDAAPFGLETFWGEGYIEKPSADVAQRLVDGGKHDWNTGIFAWDIETFFAAAEQIAPTHGAVFNDFRNRIRQMSEAERAALFANLPRVSVDDGLLSLLAAPFRHVFVRGRFAWDDLGTFAALARHWSEDSFGNHIAGDVQAIEARGSVLICESPMTLEVDGALNIAVVVNSDGDVLVCDRQRTHEIRKLCDTPLCVGVSDQRGALNFLQSFDEGNSAGGYSRFFDARHCATVHDGDGIVGMLGVEGLRVEARGKHVRVFAAPIAARKILSATQEPPARWVFLGDSRAATAERVAADVVATLRDLLDKKEHPLVVMSAGATPEPIYALLRARHAQAIDWSRLRFYQMDEYTDLAVDDPRRFGRSLRQKLVMPLGMEGRFLTGSESDDAMERYEQEITRLGGIDLVLHGVGSNGHLGFNEPGSTFYSRSRKVMLAASTRQDFASRYRDASHIAASGVTLGLGILNAARHVRVVATGNNKRRAIRASFQSQPTREWPLSSLQGHTDLRIFLDRDACPWFAEAHRALHV